jgi:anti-sigma factor RsiW
VVAGKPVPVLVYRRREHVINLFVLPASRSDLDATLTRHGYSLRHWNEGDLGFWAASDAAPVELAEFERVFRAATKG